MCVTPSLQWTRPVVCLRQPPTYNLAVLTPQRAARARLRLPAPVHEIAPLASAGTRAITKKDAPKKSFTPVASTVHVAIERRRSHVSEYRLHRPRGYLAMENHRIKRAKVLRERTLHVNSTSRSTHCAQLNVMQNAHIARILRRSAHIARSSTCGAHIARTTTTTSIPSP